MSKLLKRDIDNLCVTSKTNFDRICQNKSLWQGMSMLNYGEWFESNNGDELDLINKSRQWYFSMYTETYVFGNNENRCLALAKPAYVGSLSLVKDLTGLRAVSFGPRHTAFVRLDNLAYTSGSNIGGQRGDMDDLPVISTLYENVREVCCLDDVTYVLDNHNVLRYFGSNKITCYSYVKNEDQLFEVDDDLSEPDGGFKMMSGVTNIQKIKCGNGYLLGIELNGQIYLSQDPLETWGWVGLDTVVSDSVFIGEDGQSIDDAQIDQYYWPFYKLSFKLPNVKSFSNFKTLQAANCLPGQCFHIVDLADNYHCVQFGKAGRFLKHTLVQANVKHILIQGTFVHILDLMGNLYEYVVGVSQTRKIFTSVQSIHKFQANVLILNTEGTLFVKGRPSQTTEKFIGDPNINFKATDYNAFTPIYQNIDMFASNEDRIVMSRLKF